MKFLEEFCKSQQFSCASARCAELCFASTETDRCLFQTPVAHRHVLHIAVIVGGVNSAREQDSSVSGGTGNNCLGVVHMEEEVQVRVQVEVGREEQGEGETHGKESERRDNEEQTLNRMRMW